MLFVKKCELVKNALKVFHPEVFVKGKEVKISQTQQ
jgi:hypothetical protein